MPFGSTGQRQFVAVCALVVVMASGCANSALASSARPAVQQSPTPTAAVRSAVRHWLDSGGTAQIDVLAADFVNMGGVDRNQDWQLATACYRLLVDVGSAQAFASVPETTAQHLWFSALTAYAHGALDCARGADAHNYGVVRQASHEFDYGTADIQQLKTRLNYLTR